MILDIYQPNTMAWRGGGGNAEVLSYYKVDNHPLNVVTNQSMANIKDGSGGWPNPTVAWPIVIKPGMSSYVIPSAHRDCCGSSPLRIPHRRTGERGTSGRTSSLLSQCSCLIARDGTHGIKSFVYNKIIRLYIFNFSLFGSAFCFIRIRDPAMSLNTGPDPGSRRHAS